MTIDNIVTSVSYNGNPVEVTGTLTAWRQEKTFQFESCDRTTPGSLTILGSDEKDDQDYCSVAGMVIHCTSEDAFSPWHNFVSDVNNWKTSDGSSPCSNPTAAFVNAANNQNNPVQFIIDIVAAGGVSIWENSEAKDATMIGTPEYCEVTCTFVIDSQVTGVLYEGQQLAIEGAKDDVSMAKTVNFTSCDRMNAGSLTIHGTHNGSGDNCIEGGLLLHCSASDPQSPWNNFVSDSNNWVDDEDGASPCQDEGTSGFLGSPTADIDDLVDKGAKKIWADKVNVTLKGTPQFCSVKCSLTIDNIVNSVSYNDINLMIEGGDLTNWQEEKTVEFSSCDNTDPGFLVVNGTESDDVGPFCNKAGMILHCIAEDTDSPWHNFVSDGTNWSSHDAMEVCVLDNAAFVVGGQNQGRQWLIDMVDAGAKAIWVDAKAVSLVGTPPVG